MTRIAISYILILVIFSFSACGGEQTNSQNTKAPAAQEQAANVDKQQAVLQNPDIDIAQIMEAALNGDLASIEKALEEGFDVNSTDPEMHTALMLAAYNGHSTIIKLLLEHGAKPNLRDLKDRTALMYASTGAFNESVILLLNAGAETNLVDNEEHFTALMFAAAEGQAEVVQTLLAHGADKTLVDIDGESAYDFAMANGHQAVVALLTSQSLLFLPLPFSLLNLTS
jgi:uncharacterized protein